MTRTERFTLCLAFVAGIILLTLFLLSFARAGAAPCDPADNAQCCACGPSQAAEPAPLARIYLPTVQRDMPPMSSEFTPVQPVPTVTPDPDVELPLGDAQEGAQ